VIGFLDVQVRVMIKGRVQGVFYRNWTVGVCNPIGVKRLGEEQKGWFCGGSILW
jgi:hypothetical protein